MRESDLDLCDYDEIDWVEYQEESRPVYIVEVYILAMMAGYITIWAIRLDWESSGAMKAP